MEENEEVYLLDVEEKLITDGEFFKTLKADS